MTWQEQERADRDNRLAEIRRETDRVWAGKCRWCGLALSGETVLDGIPPNLRPVHVACHIESCVIAHAKGAGT